MTEPDFESLSVRSLTAGAICTSCIVLAGSDGQERGRLQVTEDGVASVMLWDLHGRPRVVLGVDANGCPQIGLLDSSGKVRFQASCLADRPFVQLCDSNSPRLSAWLDAQGNPHLHSFDQEPLNPERKESSDESNCR